jgi:hypothetical protein
LKVTGKQNRVSIKKVIGYNGYQGAFKVLKPEGQKGIKNGFNGVDKVRLQIPKGPS